MEGTGASFLQHMRLRVTGHTDVGIGNPSRAVILCMSNHQREEGGQLKLADPSGDGQKEGG